MIELAVPQIVELLQDSNPRVRSTGANELGKLAEQSRWWCLSPSLTRLRSILATFYETIKPAFPQIIKLLKDNDLDVQSAGANVIGKLAEQSKWWSLPSLQGWDPCLAAFHDVIKSAVTVPWIIEVLNDSNSVVQSAGANAIAKLAEQSKWWFLLPSITRLTWTSIVSYIPQCNQGCCS